MMTSKYRHDGLRDLGLGDAVMVSKERWRKHVNALDLETFPKSWIGRGLREIHHENDAMDVSRFSPFHSFSSKFEAPKHSFKS